MSATESQQQNGSHSQVSSGASSRRDTWENSPSVRVSFDLLNSLSGSSCSSGRISPETNNGSGSTPPSACSTESPLSTGTATKDFLKAGSVANYRRHRTVSGSKSEDHVMRTKRGLQVVYTAGRPPWYDCQGKLLNQPFVIGICGGSASGKTTVANRIIEALDMPWVTLLSMDSFYKVLNKDQHAKAAENNYDFDHPDAFDLELLEDTVHKLKEGKRVEVPVYNFKTHSREKQSVPMYGADVLIFEGILAFHKKEITDLMDVKIFVDTDSDTRLARRLHRDILERDRDIEGVLHQYERFVKPSFDSFIAPLMQYADIIIPRGGENKVAIDLIVKHVERNLELRGYNSKESHRSRMALAENGKCPQGMPESLHVIKETAQVKGIHTFIRDRNTPRDELIFYSKRLMRIMIEFALSLLPYETLTVQTPQGTEYQGRRKLNRDKICGVSILRAGETMEQTLREVVKDCKVGKILIQTNPKNQEPELYFLRLPTQIQDYQVLLMDATVATGAAAMMAIRVLIDHEVPPENIMLLSLIMAETGVHSLGYAHPKVKLVSSAVDKNLDEKFRVLPGIGNFGNRFFGTEVEDSGSATSSDAEEDQEVFGVLQNGDNGSTEED